MVKRYYICSPLRIFLIGLVSRSGKYKGPNRAKKVFFVEARAKRYSAVIGLSVDKLFQFFTGFEIGDTLRRDLDRRTRLWIAALAGIAFANAKTSEAAKFDLFAVIKRFDNTVKNDLDKLLGVFLRHISFLRDFFNQIRFRHLYLSSQSTDQLTQALQANSSRLFG